MQILSNISILSCGFKTAPLKVIVMLLFVFTLDNCNNELNSETIVGTWEVVDVVSKKIPYDEGRVFKLRDLINSIFKKDDLWIFNKNNSLDHKSDVGLWPQPKTYKLENENLFFYLAHSKDYPSNKPFAKFLIVDGNSDFIKITLDSPTTTIETGNTAVLKKVN